MSNDFSGLYDIRPAKPEDVNFILATFLRGLYYGESAFSPMEKKTFMEAYKPVAIAMLMKHKVTVACLKDDSDVILAYAITNLDSSILHWIQCKSAWRKKGIAKSLLSAEVKHVTHLTKLGQALLPKLKGATFDPFKL